MERENDIFASNLLSPHSKHLLKIFHKLEPFILNDFLLTNSVVSGSAKKIITFPVPAQRANRMNMCRDYFGYAPSEKVPDENSSIVASNSKQCTSSRIYIHQFYDLYLVHMEQVLMYL